MLLVVISLNLSVQCVANGFQQKDIYLFTFDRTLNRTHIRVLIVRSLLIITAY